MPAPARKFVGVFARRGSLSKQKLLYTTKMASQCGGLAVPAESARGRTVGEALYANPYSDEDDN